jgi:Family of unknown function (DUF5340)
MVDYPIESLNICNRYSNPQLKTAQDSSPQRCPHPQAPTAIGCMNPIPLPSHIHYELLLQLLERQTLYAISPHPGQREQVNQLIVTLRKAFAQQKQLEANCQQTNVEIEYRWSIHDSIDRE